MQILLLIISSYRVMVQASLVSMEMLLFLMKALNLSMRHQDFFPWWVAFSIIHPISDHFYSSQGIIANVGFWKEGKIRKQNEIKPILHTKRWGWLMASTHIHNIMMLNVGSNFLKFINNLWGKNKRNHYHEGCFTTMKDIWS